MIHELARRYPPSPKIELTSRYNRSTWENSHAPSNTSISWIDTIQLDAARLTPEITARSQPPSRDVSFKTLSLVSSPSCPNCAVGEAGPEAQA